MPERSVSKAKKGPAAQNDGVRQSVKSKSAARHKPRRKSRTTLKFPVPRHLTAEDFYEMCNSYHVLADRREELRRRIDEVVDLLISLIQRSGDRVPRTGDRQHLARTRAYLTKAGLALRQEFGPFGIDSLRAAGNTLAPALHQHWLLRQFSNRREAELLRSTIHSEFHPPLHMSAAQVEAADASLRNQFCRALPGPVLFAVVALLENSFSAALDRMNILPGARGGRRRLEARHLLLVNLAEIYQKTFEVAPTSGASPFVAFASAVFSGIGWESATESIQHAVPAALKHWKNLTKNNRSISNSTPSG